MREKAPVEKPKWQSVEDFQRYQKFQEPDYDGRGFPFRKTVLLAGPPGLGKTTLAHVAARHCGYNVVEMNASDDRSASAFADRIENAVRMTAALNQDNRPNCLIIDEIDGAGAPAINVLVKVLTAGTREEKNTEGKKKKEKRVRRPIICICNDPWVAALRDLRKISSIITFPQTASARLAQRLKTICSMEQLTADMASLLFLCEKTDNDIRSSLNTLQFFKGRKAPLSMVQLRGLDVGSKDKQQNLFKFWSTIFTQPRTSHNPLQKSKADQNYSQKRLSDLLCLVTGTGEYERQIEGIHENLLLLKIREAHFPKLVDSLEWFIFFDQTSKHVHQTMTFDLYAYLMYVPLAFHFLFAQVHPPKVTLPSKNRETRQQQQELADVCEMMRREALPHARLGLSAEYITTLLSTYLTRMLCPAFRPVNVQLYSDKEKQAKEVLLTTMACFDLQFVQHRSVEGLISYQLEPDLYKMTRYTAAAEPKQLPYSIKQMLAREVNLKRIGESAKPVAVVQQEEVNKTKSTSVKKIDYTAQDKVPVNALRKVVGNKEAFNRKGDIYVQKMRTFYKFNEGYSNAVRKPVKMSSFF